MARSHPRLWAPLSCLCPARAGPARTPHPRAPSPARCESAPGRACGTCAGRACVIHTGSVCGTRAGRACRILCCLCVRSPRRKCVRSPAQPQTLLSVLFQTCLTPRGSARIQLEFSAYANPGPALCQASLVFTEITGSYFS